MPRIERPDHQPNHHQSNRSPRRRRETIPLRPSPEHDNAHDLMPRWLRRLLPPLYASEHDPDPMVHVKYFTPDAGWTWFGVEFDGQDIFFGLVEGFERELGYFALQELEQTRGPLGLRIERDLQFQPTRLSELRARGT
jgi:DUF2958 family protein